MTTDDKVTELFCVIDDFCKYFDAENAGKLFVEDKTKDKTTRRRKSGIFSLVKMPFRKIKTMFCDP